MDYKQGRIQQMTPQLWQAKKIVDSTLHPGMSCALVTAEYILTYCRHGRAGPPTVPHVLLRLLQPGCHGRHAYPRPRRTFSRPSLPSRGSLTRIQTAGTVAWQVVNQSLNVAINSANANKSSPLTYTQLAKSYTMAVTASCSVAVGLNKLVPRLKSLAPSTRTVLSRLVPFAAVASAGALNVFLMRGEEMRTGIDVFPVLSADDKAALAKEEKSEADVEPLGRSRKAATLAVGETALSRVLNSSPIMVIPPLVLVRLQRTQWLQNRPRLTTPINLGLILATSFVALPFALAAFPQRQSISAERLEEEFHGRGGEGGLVVFNRGI